MELKAIEALIGQYGWMLFAAFVFLIARNTIESAISGLKVFLGKDLDTDDVIIININGESRPARVVRCGLWKTILFVYQVH